MSEPTPPHGGKHKTKMWLIVGGVFAGILLLRGNGGGLGGLLGGGGSSGSSSSGSAGSPPVTPIAGGASGDPYPWDGTTGNPSDPNSMDPVTGVTYGDEQSGYGGGGYYGGGSGGGYYGGGGSGGSGSGGQQYATNAQWAQAAESYLSGQMGENPTQVGAAIGHYITGQPLDPAQVSLVEQAIAFTGQPPVAGPGGNPPGYVTAPQPKPKPPVKGPTRTVAADGHQTLQQVAVANHVTEADVALWNKPLDRYIGTRKPLPRGTKVKV